MVSHTVRIWGIFEKAFLRHDADVQCALRMSAGRKFTSITDEDHSVIFEPVDALMKLSARLCIAVCFASSLATSAMSHRHAPV